MLSFYRNVITKVAETTNFITKISKTKSRSNLASYYRGTLTKQSGLAGIAGSQNKQYASRNPNKFKTGGIVATAVQPTNTKNKSKKQKSSHKLSSIQDAIAPLKTSGTATTSTGGGGDGRPSTSGGGIVLASTTTNIVRKVKTKLKKKKSSTNSQNATNTAAKDAIATYISTKAGTAGSCSS